MKKKCLFPINQLLLQDVRVLLQKFDIHFKEVNDGIISVWDENGNYDVYFSTRKLNFRNKISPNYRDVLYPDHSTRVGVIPGKMIKDLLKKPQFFWLEMNLNISRTILCCNLITFVTLGDHSKIGKGCSDDALKWFRFPFEE